MSIAVAAQWLFNVIVANNYPIINRSNLYEENFNVALPYFIFAFMCVATLLFAWKLVPETKGKSLEQIEKFWKVKK